MRVIKFRGRVYKPNQGYVWEYGSLLEGNIITNEYFYGGVSERTIGQYTGMKDLHGKEIYEGDIVSAWSQGWNAIGEVKCRIDGLWFMYPAYQHKIMWGLCPQPDGQTSVNIIGNIHDDPELIGGDS